MKAKAYICWDNTRWEADRMLVAKIYICVVSYDFQLIFLFVQYVSIYPRSLA